MTESELIRKFGENVEERIDELSMSQKELAIESDLSESSISRIIRGETMPTLKTIMRLADALACDVSELIDETMHEYIE